MTVYNYWFIPPPPPPIEIIINDDEFFITGGLFFWGVCNSLYIAAVSDSLVLKQYRIEVWSE
jgi:hypothetical protein